MSRLSLALLGAPQILHAGIRLNFPTRKVLALLAYLSVEGRSHTREELVALLWPNSGEDSGRATLRSTLARLRETLADSDEERHLLHERGTVSINVVADLELDLHHLEALYNLAQASAAAAITHQGRDALIDRLQQATSLCRGEFLEGFSLPDAPDFDNWLLLQRQFWHQRVEVVFDRLSLLQAEAGRTSAAIDTVSQWVRLSPLNELAYQRQMQLHLTSGEQAAALRAYESCRAILARELGLAPGPETQALAERCRSAATWSARSRSPVAPSPISALREAPLIGRTDEFATLLELYHTALRGRTQVAVLQGEAGIGKTRLAEEFLRWAQGQGADVLQGRAFETGSGLPYQPLVDSFRPRLERENAPVDLLSDIWLAELSRLLPELRDRYPDLPAAGTDEAAARTRLFEAVARLGQALAGRAPVVLFIDDVQWSDVASRDVLHYIARRWTAEGAAIVLVLGLRPEALAPGAPLSEWLMSLGRDLPLTRIELDPLTHEETLLLVQSLGIGVSSASTQSAPGEGLTRPIIATSYPSKSQPAPTRLAAFGSWLFAESGGQPFFIMETLKALLDRGTLLPQPLKDGTWRFDLQEASLQNLSRDRFIPSSVREPIRLRLERLTPAARALAVAAAVLGQGFTFEQLAGVAGLSESDALAGLDQLVESHLLREAAGGPGHAATGGYFFTHDKIRNVVYDQAGDARRHIFHRRAFQILEEGGAPAVQLAHHALMAGLDEAALRLSVVAGDEALQLLAARDAAAHYSQALAIAERMGRHGLLADLHARCGRAYVKATLWNEARRELSAAMQQLGPEEDEQRAELQVDLLEALWWLLDLDGLRAQAGEAIALSRHLGRRDLEVGAIGWLASVKGAEGNLPAAIEEGCRAIALAGEAQVELPGQVHTYHSLSLYWLGRLDQAIERSREAVHIAHRTSNSSLLLYSLPHLGLALAGAGRYAEAIQVFAEARRVGVELAMDTFLARAISMSTGMHLDLFNFTQAEELAQEAREKALSVNFLPPAISAGIDLLLTAARRQEFGQLKLSEVIAEVEEASERVGGFHRWLWRIRLAQARAELALAQGNVEETLRWASEGMRQSQARGRLKYTIAGLVTRAQALMLANRRRNAIADLRQAVNLARSVGAPALLLRAAGTLLALEGDDDLLSEARATTNRIAAVLPEHLRSQFEAAEPVCVLRRGGSK